MVTLIIGVVGGVLAAGGILDGFTGFLTLLGVAFPPTAGVLCVLAALIGRSVAWGLPGINSLIAAFLLYVVAGRLGLVRGVGPSWTAEGTALPTAHREVV
jgi:cytosine permease